MQDWWEVRRSADTLTEEELYVSGSTVVWSRGLAGNIGSRQIIKSMTCDSPVQHALFATFYTYPDQPALLGEPIPEEPTGQEIFCCRCCILYYYNDKSLSVIIIIIIIIMVII